MTGAQLPRCGFVPAAGIGSLSSRKGGNDARRLTLPREVVGETGAQTQLATCMKYDVASHQFVFTSKLGKNSTGAATIKASVTYPNTAFTTDKQLGITITK